MAHTSTVPGTPQVLDLIQEDDTAHKNLGLHRYTFFLGLGKSEPSSCIGTGEGNFMLIVEVRKFVGEFHDNHQSHTGMVP